jgi:hypothetical protein
MAAKRRTAPPIEKARIHPRPSPPAPRTSLRKRAENSMTVYTAVAGSQSIFSFQQCSVSFKNKEIQSTRLQEDRQREIWQRPNEGETLHSDYAHFHLN